jgi:hypothetical protein
MTCKRGLGPKQGLLTIHDNPHILLKSVDSLECLRCGRMSLVLG